MKIVMGGQGLLAPSPWTCSSLLLGHPIHSAIAAPALLNSRRSKKEIAGLGRKKGPRGGGGGREGHPAARREGQLWGQKRMSHNTCGWEPPLSPTQCVAC